MDSDKPKVYGDTSITDGLVFTQAKFLENKIYTEKRIKYDKLHSKLPIFRVKSLKIYTRQSFFTQTPSVVSDKYEVWVLPMPDILIHRQQNTQLVSSIQFNLSHATSIFVCLRVRREGAIVRDEIENYFY